MYSQAPRIEAVKKDTVVVNLTKKISLNRDGRRKGIRVSNLAWKEKRDLLMHHNLLMHHSNIWLELISITRYVVC